MTAAEIIESLKKGLLSLLAWIGIQRKSVEQKVVEPPKPVPPAPAITTPPPVTPKEILSFETPKQAWHAVRVMCDEAGLSFVRKNILCACIYQESNFFNYLPTGQPTKNYNCEHGAATPSRYNPAVHGKILSTDWGICQINDYWNIGVGKPFASVESVMKNPAKVVAFMIQCEKAGQLYLWSSFKTGAYRQNLPLSSPMWKLAEK